MINSRNVFKALAICIDNSGLMHGDWGSVTYGGILFGLDPLDIFALVVEGGLAARAQFVTGCRWFCMRWKDQELRLQAVDEATEELYLVVGSRYLGCMHKRARMPTFERQAGCTPLLYW